MRRPTGHAETLDGATLDAGRSPRAALRAAAWLLCAALLACGGGKSEGTAQAQPGADTGNATKDVKVAARQEQLFPRFEGELLAGGRGSTDLLRDQRGVVFLFSSTDNAADAAGTIMEKLVAESGGGNIAFLGVSRDPDPANAKAYLAKHKLTFPVLVDAGLAISAKLRVPAGSPAIAFVDNQGYLLGGTLIEQADQAPGVEKLAREVLRLPDAADQSLQLGVERPAPEFEVKTLEGGNFKLSSIGNKVALVMFFLHTCPHCHDALRFLNRFKAELKRDDFVIIPISLRDNKLAVEDMAKNLNIQLALYLDPNNAAQKSYVGSGVPNMYVLNREHKIVAHHEGMDGRIEALLTMEIRKELGVENPILLMKGAYSGEETCRVCHTTQHETWSLTNHAFAFDTLVERGQQLNEECLQCHTVGFKQAGGYQPELRQPFLEGVQCENCHGRGGPHQSPEFAKGGYEKVCLTCHNETHSLRFRFAERLPLISHAANAAAVSSLSLEQRRELLEKRSRRQQQLFDDGEFVGSAACQSCHAEEHKNWAASPHAKAFATLAAKQSETKAECQSCHTTGFQKPGGFPAAGAAAEAVGCESCHGPGKKHVAAETPKKGSILKLADKCDSCVILQICGSCHDEKNDPGFEFAVEKKIDRIRHHPKPSKGNSAE